MTLKRPKILTAFTVPTAGWDINFTISVAASLDQAVTATVAAGTYFMAWDAQSDDLCHELATKMTAAAQVFAANTGIQVVIDGDGKVRIGFTGNHFQDSGNDEGDVAINWGTTDADLVKALGVDSSSNYQSTGVDNPVFTASRQHAYGWYSTEDGQLPEDGLQREDNNEVTASQGVTLAGQVATVEWANRYRNRLRLAWMTAAQTWTDGQGYGDTPTRLEYPYNKGLQAWWEEARKGVRFRVYENQTPFERDSNGVQIFTNDINSSASLRDSGAAWIADPEQFKGMLVLLPGINDILPERAQITSNNATTLTLPTHPGSFSWDPGAFETCTIYDIKYSTYVLDTEETKEFAPSEIPQLDRYDFEIALRRYVA